MKSNSLKTVKRAAIAADQALVFNTPVDTGRARANWLVSTGSPDGSTAESPGAGAATEQALSQGRSKIGQYRLNTGGIFITNNLPYIQALDSGSSLQNPAGMTDAALTAALREFKKARLL